MPKLENPLDKLDEDALKVALDATNTLMRYKQFMPRTGVLLMSVCRFRDGAREALEMEPERYPGPGKIFNSLDDLTSTELDRVTGAAGILLQDRFTAVMDDPQLPRLLEGFHGDLEQQKAERRQLRAEVAS